MRTQEKKSKITMRKKSRTKDRVKTSKGRTNSSVRWLQRQINDPYVKLAHLEGLRGRSGFKIKQIDEKFRFFNKGYKVIDLGCAPGAWSQIIVKRCGAGNSIGIDLLDVEPLLGAKFIKEDFTTEKGLDSIKAQMQELWGSTKCNVVVSDMAANTTGVKDLDHLRTSALAEIAIEFAIAHLKKGGTFVCKVFQGGASQDILRVVQKHFKKAKHYKPDSSRKDSVENFLIALDFKG